MEFFVYIPEEAKPEEKDVKVQISQWLYKIGDRVEQGAELVEICTDKAVYVITAPVSGILSQVLYQEGQFFSPDEPIGIILTNQE